MSKSTLYLISAAAVAFFVAPIVGVDVALISGVADQITLAFEVAK